MNCTDLLLQLLGHDYGILLLKNVLICGGFIQAMPRTNNRPMRYSQTSPMPITALASALASAPPEQQRIVSTHTYR